MKILGVNCGNGVMIHPLKKFLVGNIETRKLFKTPNDIQWNLNFENIPLISSYSDGQNIEHVDMIIGHPDCGHSSMMSLTRIKKFTNPKDNESLIGFLSLIEYYKPSIWVMENLPKMMETLSVDDIKIRFPEYYFKFISDSVSIFGNSQVSRKRLVILAFHKRVRDLRRLFKPYPVSSLKTTGELLSGLIYGENGHIRESIDNVITMYAGYKISLKDAKRCWNHELVGKKRWIAENKNFSTAPGVYRNLENEYPATVRKQNRQFNPEGDQMSARELARIQGIPDEFKLWYDKNRETTCINKGRITVAKTPPYELGLWLYQVIIQNKISKALTRIDY